MSNAEGTSRCPGNFFPWHCRLSYQNHAPQEKLIGWVAGCESTLCRALRAGGFWEHTSRRCRGRGHISPHWNRISPPWSSADCGPNLQFATDTACPSLSIPQKPNCRSCVNACARCLTTSWYASARFLGVCAVTAIAQTRSNGSWKKHRTSLTQGGPLRV